ncbi:MAG: hypothetical protein U9P14_04395, partial [Gemmatimonadota bacterium]|nr:hypothetical protein [Gemmatimonadota bacterium]
DFKLVPVNSEKITQQVSASLVCSDMPWREFTWCYCRPRASRVLKALFPGGQESNEAKLRSKMSDKQNIILNGPVGSDGIPYAFEIDFKGLSTVSREEKLYYNLDAGGYTGASGFAPMKTGCGGRKIGSMPGNIAWIRSAEFELTWKDAGGGNLTLEVYNKTHGVAVPYSPYIEELGTWGFWIPKDYGAARGKPGFAGAANGTYVYEGLRDGVPRDERTVLQAQTIPADSKEEFAIWINNLAWKFSGTPADTAADAPIEISSMPAAGTVFTVANCYGQWNSDKTLFTQYADMPYLGDKWEIEIKPYSLETGDIDLSKIKAVPNPYIASSFLDLSPNSRRIEFVNLPDRCTIRIFSLGGHLVNVLNHIGANRHGWGDYSDYDRLDMNNKPMELKGWDNHGGTEAWNLRNRFGQTVASGLYFYHVTDVRGETHTGKFYVIN